MSTLVLIRRAFIDRHHFLTGEQFLRDWALVQVTPGINLLSLTVLIGNRLGGLLGVASSLAGLLLPSCAVTIAISACYTHFAHIKVVERVLAGIIPGTIGLGLLMTFEMLVSAVKSSRSEGPRAGIAVTIAIVAGSGIAALTTAPVVAILIGGGIIGGLTQTLLGRQKPRASSIVKPEADQ